jgi:uncharacterized membrane protein
MVRVFVSRFNETTALAAFLICTVLTGLLLIRSVPPFAGFDEPFHWFRALQISRGVPFAPQLGPNDWGGAIDLHGITYAYWFAERFADGKPIDRKSAVAYSDSLAATPPEHATISFPSSASFAPTAYMPAAIAVYIARNMQATPLAQVIAGRVAQLLAYASFVWAVVMLLPRGRLPGLAIMTMPTPLHLATCFSADPVNTGMLFLFIACCLRLQNGRVTHQGRGVRAALLGLAFLLGTLKLTYVPAVLFLCLIPAHRFSSRQEKLLFVASGVVLCGITAASWSAVYHFIPGPYWHAGGDPKLALAFIANHPLDTLHGMFDTIVDKLAYLWKDLSVRFGGGPAPYHFLAPSPFAWIELGGLASVSLLSGDRRTDLQITGLCLFVAGLVLGLLLLSFRIAYGPPDMRIVQGLQGRYFIPIVLLLALATVYASPLSSAKGRMAGFGLLLCNHLVVCAYAVEQYRALWR